MKKFARICSYTNQPINEGFYIGEEYVADTKEAKELFMAECKEYNSWDEMMEEEYSDACYYTEWEIDEEYYFDENGNLIKQSN